MEESKSSEQPRCPCGFWGSTNTMGLCSQCYKAHAEKTADSLQSTSDHMLSPEKARQMKQNSHNHSLEGGSQQPSSSKEFSPGIDYKSESSTSLSDQSKGLSEGLMSTSHEQKLSQVAEMLSNSECSSKSNKNSKNDNESSPSQTDNASLKNSDTTTLASADSDKGDSTPQKRGIKRELDTDESSLDSTPEKGPEQKNKKRCFHCKTKLELAQRQIGRCKCDYVFCSLHRLPELHNCVFDHKEDGRREAREKMVKPTRHLGTSFKRLDSS